MRFISFVTRENGKCKSPIFIEKSVRYGDRNFTTAISKRKNILIVGAHNSDKSRYLKKMYNNAEAVWKAQCRPYAFTNNTNGRDPNKKVCLENCSRSKINEHWQFPEPIFICSIEALSDWTNHDGVRDLYEKEILLEYSKATLKVKAEWMAKYLDETKAILFIDDVDKLTGRKLQVVKDMLNVAFRVVYTCKSENAINPSLRIPILESDPQILRLESDTAYDITPYFLFFIMIPFLFTISPELAVLAFLGGVSKFAHGQFATKQK